jgi:Xaa-Pro aminopeptidase
MAVGRSVMVKPPSPVAEHSTANPAGKSRESPTCRSIAWFLLETGADPMLSDPYAGDDARLPLEAGMIISIETTLPHPKRGFVKLEDTVIVTETGCEGYGDAGRGWNRMQG